MKKNTPYSKNEIFVRNGLSFSCIQFYQKASDGREFVDKKTASENFLIRQDAFRKQAGLLTSEEIKAIRQSYHLSQKDFAQILGLGKIDIVRYETKAVQTRSINDTILRAKEEPLWFAKKFSLFANKLTPEKRAEVLNAIENYAGSKDAQSLLFARSIELTYLPLLNDDEAKGRQEFSPEAIVSILALAALSGTKLFKGQFAQLLFYCDFLSYKRTGKGLTGIAYSHASFGVWPLAYDDLLACSKIKTEARIYDSKNGNEYFSYTMKSVGKNTLSREQTTIVKRVLRRLGSLSSEQLLSFTREENGYRETKKGEIISYRFAKDLRGF